MLLNSTEIQGFVVLVWDLRRVFFLTLNWDIYVAH